MVLSSCILFWSLMNGIEPAIVNSVIQQESSFNPLAIGQGKDFGLMQIRAKYVPYTKHQLLNSCTNIMVGTKILRKVKESCKLCGDNVWLVGYNTGIKGFTRIKYPRKFPYYLKIMKGLK